MITIGTGPLRLNIDPALGSSLVALQWLGDGDVPFDILHRANPDAPGQGSGCFVMVPFANRLAGGQFVFGGRTVAMAINNPAQNAAVHGFSRGFGWDVIEQGPDLLVTRHRYREPGSAFDYEVTQTALVAGDTVSVALVVTNRGTERLPFGMGLHPWFTREAGTMLTFAAATAFGRDAMGFADDPVATVDGGRFARGIDTSTMEWFDGHFAGWFSRSAEIVWPSRKLALTLSTGGALENLHIYVPDDRPVLCVEPVSHVPDVHNRREFARYSDLRVLAPTESLQGMMRLRVGPAQA